MNMLQRQELEKRAREKVGKNPEAVKEEQLEILREEDPVIAAKYREEYDFIKF